MIAVAGWLCVAGTASCERILMPDESEECATEVFDELWQQVDRRYPLFDVKGVDWGRVYDTLRPKVWDGMEEDSLFHVCATMLGVLRDGHVNLYGRYEVSHSDSVYYRFYAEGQVDASAVVLGYLGAGYRTTGGVAHAGLMGGRVAYLRYASFSNSISAWQLRYILGCYGEAEGVIFDIRGNGGGSTDNIRNILSMLPSHGQLLYRSQMRSGPGHDDFSPLVETYAPEGDGGEGYGKPVVVLMDRGCYSASSTFVLCCRAYPNVVLLGDTTGGGLGFPTMGYLPGGWRYRMPVTRVLAPGGENYEEGVPPHRVLRLDRRLARECRRDNIIDSACGIITRESPRNQIASERPTLNNPAQGRGRDQREQPSILPCGKPGVSERRALSENNKH